MTMLPTRGQRALPSGVTPKMLAARTKRSLASIRQSLEKLAQPWAEVDPMVPYAHEQLLAAFEEFEQQVNQSVAYLNETAP